LRKGGFLAHRSPPRSEDETEIRAGERTGDRSGEEIRRATRRHFSAEDKIRIVLEGLRGEDSIAELRGREGIVQNLRPRFLRPAGGSRRTTGV
jgi:transposase